MFKKYKVFVFCFFCVTSSAFAKNSYDYTDKSYVYLESGAEVDILSSAFVHLKSFNSDKNIWQTQEINMSSKGNIAPVLIVGYYVNSYKLSLEAEIGQYIVYETETDGKPSTKKDDPYSYFGMTYFLINFKKDLLNIFSKANVIYAKAGFGFGVINNLQLTSGTNVPNVVYQFGLGFTRKINAHIDFNIQYTFRSNIYPETQLSSGTKTIYNLTNNSILTSIRFKV